MASVKRMINGYRVAVLALVLGAPISHANSLNARNVQEGNRPSAGQYQQRNPREVQRKEAGEKQRPQRLSPEERRQLRRDIKDAGREIYPPRR